MGLTEYTAAQALNAQLGQGGYVYIDQAGTDNTGTAATGVEYVAVTIIEGAATIATVSNDINLWPNSTIVGIPAGTTIYGRWNLVTVSGSNCTAICYRG